MFVGELGAVTVGCEKYPEPGLVIVTLVTTPLTTFAVAAACVPDPPGAEIVSAKSPV